jgi:hypothetical protein
MASVQFYNGWDWDNHPEAQSVQLVSMEVAMNAVDKGMAEIGKTFPVEFVGSLADNAKETVEDWLTANHVKPEVIDLLEGAILLYQVENDLHAGELSEHDAADLVNKVADATRLIAALGGVFHSAASVSNPREPIQA